MAKNKPQKKYNDKEKLELVTAICELYATGQYTIESCCENNGITARTFTDWISSNSELSELYKNAKKSVKEKNTKELVNLAFSEFKKRILGYTVIEETQEGINKNGVFVTTKAIKRKIHVRASDAALIFALKNSVNTDADVLLSDTQQVEHSINAGSIIVLPAKNETEEKPDNLLNELLK